MLAVKQQGKIIEKIIRTKSGEFVFATFFITERDRELDVRLLHVKPIGRGRILKIENKKLKNAKLFLSGNCQKSPTVISYKNKRAFIISPFFNKFAFLVSQPTRAPSYTD